MGFIPLGNSSRYWSTISLTLSFQYLTGVSWTSVITLLQEEGLDMLSLLKNSDSSFNTSGLTDCLVDLDFAGGVPPRPNKIQWTFMPPLLSLKNSQTNLATCCKDNPWRKKREKVFASHVHNKLVCQ